MNQSVDDTISGRNITANSRTIRFPFYTARTEYACLAMLELAASYGTAAPVRLRQIAEKHNISHRFLVQIFLQLKAAGLVRSARGAGGGYFLGSDPKSIAVYDVVKVVDSTIQTENGNLPEHPFLRAVHQLWTDAMHTQMKLLQQCSLADLLERSQEQFDASYQI